MEEQRVIKLTEPLVQAILDYLSERPYKDVANLINGVVSQSRAQAAPPELQPEEGQEENSE